MVSDKEDSFKKLERIALINFSCSDDYNLVINLVLIMIVVIFIESYSQVSF